MSKHKLDIFRTLDAINKKDREFFDKLTEEEKKAFAPLVVMRWMTGTSDQRQIYFINELVNSVVFQNAKHKKLLYQLLTICASGGRGRYKWIATKKRSSGTSTIIEAVQQFFKYSSKEAVEALPLLSDNTILSIADDLGYQKDKIDKIKKELKVRAK